MQNDPARVGARPLLINYVEWIENRKGFKSENATETLTKFRGELRYPAHEEYLCPKGSHFP